MISAYAAEVAAWIRLRALDEGWRPKRFVTSAGLRKKAWLGRKPYYVEELSRAAKLLKMAPHEICTAAEKDWDRRTGKPDGFMVTPFGAAERYLSIIGSPDTLAAHGSGVRITILGPDPVGDTGRANIAVKLNMREAEAMASGLLHLIRVARN